MRFLRFGGGALALVVLFSVVGIGCASQTIRGDELYKDDPNFRIDEEAKIEDTTRNRKVLDVVAQYRKAVTTKDFGTLKRLVSEEYYDNGGTTDTTEDDYGFERLEEVWELMANHAEEIKYTITIKDVSYQHSRAQISYEYRFAYKYKLEDKPTWDAGVEVNQIQMVKKDDRWRIISGL